MHEVLDERSEMWRKTCCIVHISCQDFLYRVFCCKQDTFVGMVSFQMEWLSCLINVDCFQFFQISNFFNGKWQQLIVGNSLQAAPEEGQAAQPPAEVRPKV